MAQSQARQVRVRSNESTLDEIAGYWVKLYSVPRNAAALTEDGLVQCNIKWHSVGWNYFEYIQTVQGRGKLEENFEKFNEVHENEISEIMEHCMNWFSIKLDLGGASVRWSWNHKKYKRWVEQLRVNRDRGQYDILIGKFWHQTLRSSFNHRDQPASCFTALFHHCHIQVSLFCFTMLYKFAAVQP